MTHIINTAQAGYTSHTHIGSQRNQKQSSEFTFSCACCAVLCARFKCPPQVVCGAARQQQQKAPTAHRDTSYVNMSPWLTYVGLASDRDLWRYARCRRTDVVRLMCTIYIHRVPRTHSHSIHVECMCAIGNDIAYRRRLMLLVYCAKAILSCRNIEIIEIALFTNARRDAGNSR